jgi:hypothetical protein
LSCPAASVIVYMRFGNLAQPPLSRIGGRFFLAGCMAETGGMRAGSRPGPDSSNF